MHLLLTFLFVAAHRDGLATRVRYDATADVATLAKELGKRAGVELEASAQLKTVLIVHLDDVPLSEAMSRIAWATYGRWERRGERFRLVYDSDQEKRFRRELMARADLVMKPQIERFRQEMLKEEITDRTIAKARSDWQKWRSDHSFPMPSPNTTPVARRGLARVLPAIRPADLVLEEPPLFRCYSDHPNASQIDLGPLGQEVLRAYNLEIGVWQTASPDEQHEVATHCVVSGQYRGRGGVVRIGFYGEKGGLVGFAEERFPDPDRQDWRVAPQVVAAVPPDVKVPLSSISQIFGEAEVKQYDDGPRDFSKFPDFLNRLRQPERFDPLGTFTTDAWTEMARRMKRSLVVNLEDEYFVPSGHEKGQTLLQILARQWPHQTKIEDGWIVARTDLLAGNEFGSQFDRSVLGRYARRGKLSDVESVEARGAFAGSSDALQLPFAVGGYVGQLTGEYYFDKWAFFRFYGRLPLETRRTWLRGASEIPIRSLPLTARQALYCWALESTWPLTYAREPSVRFPRGLPDSGYLHSEPIETPGFYTRVHFDDGQVAERWQSERDMAIELDVYEQGKQPWMGDFEIQEAPKREFRLGVRLGPTDELEGPLFAGPGPDPQRYTRWSQIPPAFRARMRVLVDKVRKELEPYRVKG